MIYGEKSCCKDIYTIVSQILKDKLKDNRLAAEQEFQCSACCLFGQKLFLE